MRDAYREHAPPADLATHVACTWTRTIARDTVEPIIPDACVDVLVTIGQAPSVAGPADRTAWLALRGGTTIAGIRFRPGAAREVLRTSLDSLRNAFVDLAAVTRAPSIDPDDPRASLERWARGQLERSRRDGAVVHAARVLFESDSVDAAADALGWGARRLHRQVTAACGYGPKLLQRVLRVQRAIRLAHAGTRSLAALAGAAGYADQAHMTREFTELTDLSPARYLALADPRVGQWLVSDLFKTRART